MSIREIRPNDADFSISQDLPMPTHLIRCIPALAATLLLGGCLLGLETENAEPSEETKAKENDVMTAAVAGVPWSVRANDTWFDVVSLVENAIGGRNTATYVAFRLKGLQRTGTIPIGGTVMPYAAVELRRSDAVYTHNPVQRVGTMTITELTPTRISGTYSFTVSRVSGNVANTPSSVEVTNGSFSLAVWPPYSVSITP
jgi:hypothetical protein